MVTNYGLMDPGMKDTGKMIKLTEWANLCMLMVIYMRENG